MNWTVEQMRDYVLRTDFDNLKGQWVVRVFFKCDDDDKILYKDSLAYELAMFDFERYSGNGSLHSHKKLDKALDGAIQKVTDFIRYHTVKEVNSKLMQNNKVVV